MAGLIRGAIAFFLANYAFTFLVLGLLVGAAALARSQRRRKPSVMIETLLAWHVFFSIGMSYLYNFVMHVLFGRMSAAFIGWADSPFQVEVGTASLGFAAVGFLAAFRSFDLRLAAVLGPAIFSLGAAAGHVYQMMAARNFAPGNAGLIFYMDMVVPAVGFTLLWLSWRSCRSATA